MNFNHPLNCVTFNLQRAARQAIRGFEAAARSAGLTSPQFTTLSLIAGFGSVTVTQLAELLGADRTTLTRNLDVMARKGWINGVEADDQRLHIWELTDAGRAAREAALPVWQAYQRGLVDRIGPDKAEGLLTLLKSF
jgi:DNA-binding MarR family transcriptional regulator